jgi:hypothetical protein
VPQGGVLRGDLAEQGGDPLAHVQAGALDGRSSPAPAAEAEAPGQLLDEPADLRFDTRGALLIVEGPRLAERLSEVG